MRFLPVLLLSAAAAQAAPNEALTEEAVITSWCR
jgi:hypothetical protein